MAVDIDQAGAVRLLVDQMVGPRSCRRACWAWPCRKTPRRPLAAELYMVSKPSFSALSAQGKERAFCRRSRAYGRLGGIREALMPKAKTAKAKATTAKAKAKPKSAARAANRSRPSRGRVRPVSRAKPKARPKQRFTASHFRDEDFQTGLRSYAAYRDLGISDATGGMVQAHVIRFVPPCRPEEVSKLHNHEVDFQMVYVLKGWIKSEFDGQGAVVMRTGSCWIATAAHRAQGARLFGRLRSARNHPAGGLQDRRQLE